MRGGLAETARGRVEYFEAGCGSPILYFHGTAVTGDVMLAVERPLVDAGFRLIVPNRPGYGRTPLSQHRTADGCADVAAALLESLGIGRAGVIGSSGGATFALAFALRHAAMAQSVVLLCPQVHRWSGKRWMPQTSRWTLPLLTRRPLRRLLLKLYRFHLRRMSPDEFLKTQAGERYPEVAADGSAVELCRETLAAMARASGDPGFENDMLVFALDEIGGAGESLRSPTLVIHDPADPIAPVDHVDWLLSRFPSCERLAVHAAGHLVWVGPGAHEMHAARVRFLNRQSPRPRTPPPDGRLLTSVP